MIKSMTGYGSAKGTVEGLQITVELKSVNNRYLDASVRLPRSFLFAEDAVKSAVQRHISRGKVDVFVTVDASEAGDMNVKVNEPLLRGPSNVISVLQNENIRAEADLSGYQDKLGNYIIALKITVPDYSTVGAIRDNGQPDYTVAINLERETEP